MKINDKYEIKKFNDDNRIYTNLFDGKYRTIYPVNPEYNKYNAILKVCRKRKWSVSTQNRVLRNNYASLFGLTDVDEYLITETVVADNTTTDEPVFDRESVKRATSKFMDFFSEFGVDVSMRFLNTFAHNLSKDYVYNYFAIQNHSYMNEIKDKMKSPEFQNIIDTFKKNKFDYSVNTHFKVYYGAPGTGKTTKAMSEASKCIVCSSDMLPTDLMQNFAFSDGKAEFQKSDLWIAIENGEKIVLDEINMLPFESLRFLQGITDSKEFFNYRGFEIKIHPDFEIIGTMNLMVNGNCMTLPEPLVDRCSDIKEFKLDAEMLMRAFGV